jgi:hypothetical protein
MQPRRIGGKFWKYGITLTLTIAASAGNYHAMEVMMDLFEQCLTVEDQSTQF